MEDAHLRSTSEVLTHFGILDAKRGLSSSQVKESRAVHGKNGEPHRYA